MEADDQLHVIVILVYKPALYIMVPKSNLYTAFTQHQMNLMMVNQARYLRVPMFAVQDLDKVNTGLTDMRTLSSEVMMISKSG